jgi:hypothetical protein
MAMLLSPDVVAGVVAMAMLFSPAPLPSPAVAPLFSPTTLCREGVADC